MRPVFHWNLGSRSLELGKRTLIMGIVNVTPDSFSDGGEFFDPDNALKHALRLLDQGADIVDVGGESTRPGARVEAAEGVHSEHLSPAPTVSAEAELKRVVPVITDLKKRCPAAVISVDTYKSTVARAAVNAGAEIVNDVSGFHWDSQMISTLADLHCGAVLMHMRGRPEQWRKLPPPEDVVSLVKTELEQWAGVAVSAGLQRGHIVLDPGFGFGKSFDENYPLIARFEELHSLGFPLLAGTSRKSFIGRTVGGEKKVPPSDRLFGTIATETALILKGAHIIRTHDVKASVHAARVADAILQAE
ncbi:MAG: dihydropteroate synthase [Acidobacteria bacterium 13_1_20CM_4_56_7]|nr:MAG: dihydropteroate synthase [Acidobacteria bacterium 13_1_20CM_4_56_7]